MMSGGGWGQIARLYADETTGFQGEFRVHFVDVVVVVAQRAEGNGR